MTNKLILKFSNRQHYKKEVWIYLDTKPSDTNYWYVNTNRYNNGIEYSILTNRFTKKIIEVM